MNFKQWLTESVTISVQGAEKPQVKDLASLESALLTAIFKIPGLKDRVRWETIGMDGYDTQALSGNINFYHFPELTPDDISKITKAISYYLGELGVKQGQPRVEQSNMYKIPVTRFPVEIAPVQDDVPELNIANKMASIIFYDLLNYPNSINLNGAELDPKDLLVKLSGVTDFNIGQHTSDFRKEKNVIHGGVDTERITRILDTLTKIAQYAAQNGHELTLS